MSRYHFHLRADGKIRRDPDGTELSDFEAAHAHAFVVAEQLVRHSSARTRHWSMFVEDERGTREFDVFFADVDPSFASPQSQMLASQTCRRIATLMDLRSALSATLIESSILLARARRKPHLVYARGK